MNATLFYLFHDILLIMSFLKERISNFIKCRNTALLKSCNVPTFCKVTNSFLSKEWNDDEFWKTVKMSPGWDQDAIVNNKMSIYTLEATSQLGHTY